MTVRGLSFLLVLPLLGWAAVRRKNQNRRIDV